MHYKNLILEVLSIASSPQYQSKLEENIQKTEFFVKNGIERECFVIMHVEEKYSVEEGV